MKRRKHGPHGRHGRDTRNEFSFCLLRMSRGSKEVFMLTAIRIGNFKAFAEAQRVPIRPLTLIYGSNSSGKSSVLHSLLLARHAQETGDLDVHRTNVGGEAVDLGGFRQYIHRRDIDRRMGWSVEIDSGSFSGRVDEMLFYSLLDLEVER